MNIITLTADVLVVGGSTGSTAAAIQAARRGAIPPICELMRGNRRASHANSRENESKKPKHQLE